MVLVAAVVLLGGGLTAWGGAVSVEVLRSSAVCPSPVIPSVCMLCYVLGV